MLQPRLGNPRPARTAGSARFAGRFDARRQNRNGNHSRPAHHITCAKQPRLDFVFNLRGLRFRLMGHAGLHALVGADFWIRLERKREIGNRWRMRRGRVLRPPAASCAAERIFIICCVTIKTLHRISSELRLYTLANFIRASNVDYPTGPLLRFFMNHLSPPRTMSKPASTGEVHAILITTVYNICHVFCFILLLFGVPLEAQIYRPALPSPVASSTPEPSADVEKRVQAGTGVSQEYVHISSVTQEVEGPLRHLRGMVLIETSDMKLKADEVDYNADTGDAEARGHVHFEHLVRGEILDCDHAEYNTETQTGKFYTVTGTAAARIQARKGLLTTRNPFYFEGKLAERLQDHYILHDGFLTDCLIPRPWWRLKSKTFLVVPEDHAITKQSWLYIRQVPIFYFPFFYKSLKKEPRKSGFLTPNIGHGQRGYDVGLGYFWAINRSYDMAYRARYFSQAGLAHYLDFRGDPNDHTKFDILADGLKDQRLDYPSGSILQAHARSYLGNGWEARGELDYISSYAFRQQFTESFNEAVFSQTHSVAFAAKHWSDFGINIVTQRNVSYEDATVGNEVSSRKLPEGDFVMREHSVTMGGLPFWVSLNSSAGLLKRSDPAFQTRSFVPRLDFAPHLTTSVRWAGIQVTPSVGIEETFYDSSVAPDGTLSGNNVMRSSRDLSVDVVLPSLERVFDAPPFLATKLKHVIEPRVTYKNVSGIGDINPVIRFDGTDVLSNTNQVEFSLTNRLLAKDKNGTVSDLLTWQLWFDHYFDPTFGGAILPNQRNILQSELDLTGYSFLNGARHSSPVVSSVRYQKGAIGVEWRTDYDPVRHVFAASSASVFVKQGQWLVLASHNSLKTDPVLAPSANQFFWRVVYGATNRKGLSYGADVLYDAHLGQVKNVLTQVTYNTDCCGLSVQYQRPLLPLPLTGVLAPRSEWRVAFAISNIGSFGNIKQQARIF